MFLVDGPSQLQDATGLNLTGLTPTAAYAKIKAEIKRSREHTRSLKSLHNSVAFISHLPDELLSMIMHITYHKSSDPSGTRLVLTWVCRHWRSVALRDPWLWRTIKDDEDECDEHLDCDYYCPDYIDDDVVPFPPKYVQTCIDRSGNAGLHVELRRSLISPLINSCLLRLFTTNMEKIESLNLTCSGGSYHRQQIQKRMEELFNQPAPQLSSLSLTKTYLPTTPFNGATPNLRYIQLVRCVFDWYFPQSVASTLTTLRISNPSSRSVFPSDIFATKLSMMPCLDTLYLRSCLDWWNGPLKTRVIFPSLRIVSVRDDCQPALFFLHCIDAPKILSTYICIDGAYALEEDEEAEEELVEISNVVKRFHPSLWSDVRHLTIHSRDIEVGGSLDGSVDKIVLPYGYRDYASLPSILCGQPSINHLETLSITAWYDALPGIVGSLESIHTIRFDNLNEENMTNLLVPVQEASGNGPIPFPSLMENHCDRTSQELYRVLEKRQEILQKPLPRLTFCECSSADVEQFKGVADFVAEDGIVNPKPIRTYYEDDW